MKIICVGLITLMLNCASARSTLNTKSYWKIQSKDLDFYTLSEDELNGKVYYTVTFGKGQKEIRSFPMPKKPWESWKNRLIQNLSDIKQKCANPILFEAQIAGQMKTQYFCFSKNDKRKIELEKLTSEMRRYLFG